MHLHSLVSLLFLIISSIAYAAMWALKFKNFRKSIFYTFKNYSYWDPNLGWYKKWKMVDFAIIPNTKRPWYYLWLYKPEYVEKFPYSSTFLVSLTDGFHLLQFIFLNTLFLGLVFYQPTFNLVLDFILLRVICSQIFEWFYSKVFYNPNKYGKNN
jgi:hypothetical protein